MSSPPAANLAAAAAAAAADSEHYVSRIITITLSCKGSSGKPSRKQHAFPAHNSPTVKSKL
jgi:hypothetical protein